MLTVVRDADVRPLPDVSLVRPMGADKVTPMADVLGLDAAPAPAFVLQARRLAEVHSENSIAWARLAQAEMAVGNDDGARDAARSALRCVGSSYSAGRLAAASILTRFGDEVLADLLGGVSHPVARLAAARAAIQEEDYLAALGYLRGVDGPAADSIRAYCLVETGESAASVAIYRRLRKAGRDSVDLMINLGVALARLGSIEKAIRVTREASALSPANVTAAFNLTRYYLRLGRRAEAVRELDRVSAQRPSDYRISWYRAWIYATARHDSKMAIRILGAIRSQISGSGDEVARADVAGSIAYLRHGLGEIDKVRAKRELWAAVRLADGRSAELLGMLAALLDKRSDLDDLDRLISSYGGSLPQVEKLLLLSKRSLVAGSLEEAVSAALEAATCDESNSTAASGTAAYLVGEIRGDYGAAVELAKRAYEGSPDELTANNYAFFLALTGRSNQATRLLSEFSEEYLPFHGATLGLAALAQGYRAAGMELYERAVERLRESGDSNTADLVRVRALLALREFGYSGDGLSNDSVAMAWPSDRDDPRVAIMGYVAARVGITVLE